MVVAVQPVIGRTVRLSFDVESLEVKENEFR